MFHAHVYFDLAQKDKAQQLQRKNCPTTSGYSRDVSISANVGRPSSKTYV